MATRKVVYDRKTLPPHGPGTDGPVWCRLSHRWVFPLNAHGRAVAEAFLAKYRHAPEISIASYDGGQIGVPGRRVLACAMLMLGEDETRSVALEAVVRASANYQPADHGCDAGGFTYLVNGVYMALHKANRSAILRESRVREVQAATDYEYGGECDTLGETAGYEPDPAEVSEMQLWREGLDQLAKCLPQRERQVICCRYKHGWTLQEVASRLGVSRERVRQMETAALGKLRRAFARAGVNPNNSEDGAYPPPPRSPRCPRNRPSAAR